MELFLLNNKEDRKKFKAKCGIYALLYQDQVIYIGQSRNIQSRLKSHNVPNKVQSIIKEIVKEDGNCNRCKSLAMYCFIDAHREDIQFSVLQECRDDELSSYEEYYINQFKPRFNYKGINVPYM